MTQKKRRKLNKMSAMACYQWRADRRTELENGVFAIPNHSLCVVWKTGQIISLVIIKDKYPSIVRAEAEGRRKWGKASKLNLT